MKTITYTFGIFALLLTMSSCTVDELESAKDDPQNAISEQAISEQAISEQAKSIIDSVDTGDIDPPIPVPKP